MAPKIPYYDLEALERKAGEFLARYHASGSVPLPIEEIIEFELGISVVPIPGLSEVHQLHGFLSSDLSLIHVDQKDMERSLPRYRFTLAHELGHSILHREFFEAARFSTVAEWKQVVNELSPRDNSFFEYHANMFAGMILVPLRELREHWAAAMVMAKEAGFSEKDPVAKEFMASYLAKSFLVSSEVILRRLQATHIAGD